jgi:hypothetical protein
MEDFENRNVVHRACEGSGETSRQYIVAQLECLLYTTVAEQRISDG